MNDRLSKVVSVVLTAVTFFFISPAHVPGAEILQTYYAPFPEDDMRTTLTAIDAYRGYIGNEMRTAVSIAAGMNGTVIYYDHWEDGYEADITSPTQTTTRIWGDDNWANGIPPGFTQDVINAGTLINLEATIDVTRNVLTIEYDGRDKISATRPISLTRGLYAISPGEVLAEACSAFDVGLHGRLYRAPAGVGTGVGGGTNVIFSYSSFYIMGSHDFTRVELDKDNDGVFEETRFLNAGQPWFVHGGVVAGATVKGSKPFQCHLVTGDIGSTYEMRWFELWPEDKWGSDYYSPVGSRLFGTTPIPAIVYFFNPNTQSIQVVCVTQTGTSTVSVAAGSVSAHFMMPQDSGGRFYTTNDARFLGLLVFDTYYGGGTVYGYVQHCQDHEWGIGLIPRNTLTTMGLCSWGPGYGTTGTGTNANPIWVTAISNTTLYVDFDGDPTTGPLTDPLGNKYNFATNVSYLQSVQLLNNVASNQTRMRFYTLDGTPLAAAWGQDPQRSGKGNPYLDMGYNILPFPTVLTRKYATLFTDVNTNGVPDPGDSLEFRVDVINAGFATANNVIFRDDLPTNVTVYVNNSSYLNGAPVPDDLPPRPTRFPFDGPGYDIGTLPVGQTSVVRYLTTITTTLPSNFLGYVHNNASVMGTNANWSSASLTNILLGGLALYKTSSTTNLLNPSGLLTYTLTLVNTGQFTYTGVTLEDAFSFAAAYVSNSTWITAPGGLTNTVWDRFNTISFSNNNGTLSWLTPWQEVGESDGPQGGRIRVSPDTNMLPMESYALVVCGSNAAARRAANLAGHSSAFLSFRYRRDSLPDAARFVDVFLSTNNWASSNFLLRLQGAATDTNFLSTDVEISAFISTNTAIQFLSSSAANMGLTNRVWFDDVLIRAVGSNATFAGNPPPVLAQNLTLPPGTSITAQLTVLISDPPLCTQVVNVARARAEQHEAWLYAGVTNYIHGTGGVAVAKSVSPAGLVAPGTNLLYTITVSNTGNITQTGVRLDDYLPLGVTYVTGSAVLVRNYLHTNMVRDVFNSRTYTNQDGNVDWSAAWVETGDDGFPTSGAIQVAVDNNVSPGRAYAVRMDGATRGFQRTADLRWGYTNAILSFEFRRENLDAAGDTLTVQASADGGATWSAALATIAGPGTDASYLTTNLNITAWISSNTTVRFLTSGTVVSPNTFWLDDIRITYSGVSATNRLRAPPELLDGTYDLPAGRTLTIRLNALVNDPPASTQLVNTVCYRSDQSPDCRYAYATNTQNASLGLRITKLSGLTNAWSLGFTNDYLITVENTGTLSITGGQISDVLPPGLSFVTGSAQRVNYYPIQTNVTSNVFLETVSDQFNVIGYNNNNGTTNWLNTWVEVGDDNNPTSGNVRIQTDIAPTSSIVWTAAAAANDYITRSLALPGAPGLFYTNITLSFAYRRVLWDITDSFTLTVSTNNFTSTQSNEVFLVGGAAANNTTDAGYTTVSTNITSFIGTNLALRLRGGPNFGVGDAIYFDYVTIAYSGFQLLTNFATNVVVVVSNLPAAQLTNLLSDITLAPGSNISVRIFATLDTPMSATQFVDTATFTSTQAPPISAWATNFAVPVAVGDWVWFDANTNGIQDAGEVGVSGVVVRLYTATTNLVATTNTSAGGYYLFSGWPAGSYFVEFVKPTGYWFTAQYQGGDRTLDSDADPVTGRTPITNLVSGTNLTLDAGLYIPPSAIGNWVWFDSNTNGVQDGGEPGVTGAVVRLYNSASNLLVTTTTDAAGYYAFTNLPAGHYFVEFLIPTQYVFTLANQGANAALDSDADPVTGRTPIFTLPIGTNDTTWDAGVVNPVRGLVITKASGLVGCGNPGATATYTIVVRNTNVFAQTGVTVSDPTPAGSSWLTNSIFIQAPSAGFTGTPPILAHGYTLGANQAMTVTVRYVISTPTAGTQLLNTASAYSAGNPAVQASVTNCLVSADLQISKTASDSYASEVQVIEYTVTVTNKGPDTATDVKVTDLLPAQVQYNSHSNGTYNAGSGLWTIGTLPAFGSTSLYINVTVREGTAHTCITNIAVISAAGQFDPATNNNTAANTLCVTLIVLARFGGVNINGQVALEWETAAEIGTVGFHLYRREPGGAEVQVTKDLLPSVVGAPQGGLYRFVDPTAEPGRTYLYELEEIEATGNRIRYGPFEINVPAGKAVRGGQPASIEPYVSEARASSFRESRLARAAGEAGALSSRRAPARASRSSESSEWPRLKVRVSQPGLHYLDAQELADAAGAAADAVREAIGNGEVRLSRQGEAWAWHPALDNAGLYFFAPALESPFTARDAYWVDWTAGVRMAVSESGTPGVAPDGRVFDSVLRAESNVTPITYYAESVYDDYWIWSALTAPRTSNFVLNVADPAGGVRPTSLRASAATAELTAWLWGATTTGRTNEHTVTVRLNGQPLVTEVWSGVGRRTLTAALDPALLRNGANTVSVSAARASGVPYSIVYVDKFDLRYPRLYRARQGRLDFPAQQGASATVRGLASPDVIVVGVAAPAAPVWVSDLQPEEDAAGGYRVSFDSPVAGQCWVSEASAVRRADEVAAAAPSAWRAESNRADFIILTPSFMAGAAETLAEHRCAQGLSAVVVPLEEIFDEFHGGLEEPEAIRTFLEWARGTWEQPPRYVLLAGLGTEDYKNFTGTAQNLVPVMLVRQAAGLFCSDSWFADPDDDGIPSVAVGRLPVISAAELSETIAKIIRAETAGGGAWRQTVVLAADRPDHGGDFVRSSAEVENLLPRDYLARTVSVAALGFPDSRTALRSHIRDGASVINYFGHGGLDRIAADAKTGQALLDVHSVEALGNTNRLPLVTSMSCALGRFSLQNYDCLGTVLLLQTNAGASALWAPSGNSYNQPARVLADGFYRALFRHGTRRIGEAMIQACEQYMARDQMPGLPKIYNLLGDPAMPLAGTAFLGAVPTFGAWRDAVFTDSEKADPDLGGDWADPDGDGLPNIAEYALGGNPFVADGDFEILPGGTPRSNGLVIEYQRRRGVRDVNFGVEASESLILQEWFDGSDYLAGETVTDDGNGLTETVQLSIRPEADQGPPRLFIRLRLQP